MVLSSSKSLDTAYRVGFLGTEGIRRIGNWLNAFSCEVLALIRRISFVVYGVLVRNEHSSNIFVLAPNYAPFSLSSQNTPELLYLSTLKQLSAQDQACNSAMVVPVLETAVPPRVSLAPHQIPSRISMAQNQYTRTYS
ncbi:hypothetical protein Tco_1243531 [Tanacetum coccineum]